MQIGRRKFLVCSVLGLTISLEIPAVAESGYPDGPVHFVVGAPPGGSNDIVARVLCEQLQMTFKQPFLVENRDGASGARAAEYVTHQPANGQTLLMANVATHAINPILLPDSSFRPQRDSIPVATIGTICNILVVTPSLPVQSVAELIAYAKAHPGKLNFGSAGAGGSVHLCGELFKLRTGVDIVHVPYRGSGPMVTDLIAGVVQLAFDNFPSSIGAVRAGSLRALAVTSAQRWPLYPQLPTMIESGVPNFVITTWFGVAAKIGTPASIVTALSTAIGDIIKAPEFVKRLADLGAIPLQMSPAEFTGFVAQQQVMWKEIVEDAHVKLE